MCCCLRRGQRLRRAQEGRETFFFFQEFQQSCRKTPFLLLEKKMISQQIGKKKSEFIPSRILLCFLPRDQTTTKNEDLCLNLKLLHSLPKRWWQCRLSNARRRSYDDGRRALPKRWWQCRRSTPRRSYDRTLPKGWRQWRRSEAKVGVFPRASDRRRCWASAPQLRHSPKRRGERRVIS